LRRHLGWRAPPRAAKAAKREKAKKVPKLTPFFEYDVGNATADSDLTFSYGVKEVHVVIFCFCQASISTQTVVFASHTG
jgi:hypothetical protein